MENLTNTYRAIDSIIKNLQDKKDALKTIRFYLTEEGERKRFDMSGYDSEKTGDSTTKNMDVLNTFAFLGIYDYTHYLFLDFYKGTPTLYMRYFNDSEDLAFEFSGYTTSEIIYEVFLRTILSGKPTRRRN
jgi:hypothetical protein